MPDVAPLAQGEDHLAFATIGQIKRRLDCRTRIEPRSGSIRESLASEGRGLRETAVPSDELGPVARHRPRLLGHTEERNPAGELQAVRIP